MMPILSSGHRWFRSLPVVLGFFVFAIASSHGAEAPVRSVTGGQIQGTEEDGVLAFKGIPFAAPPTGANRWRAPQPVIPWEGVRKTTDYAPPAMQSSIPVIQRRPSEDCLYLNVHQPKDAGDKPLPVMVWIHGGAFKVGSSADQGAARLAQRGVVVVSVAYRLGIFGFLAHPDLSAESDHGSGTYGLHDQLAALRWVRENIRNFGGDPGNVTIFGVSAGASSVSILTASPLGKGLFHRAIAQSGASFNPIKKDHETGLIVRTLKRAETDGIATLATVGAADLAQARALPAKKLLDAKGDTWPVMDAYVITGDQYQLYQQGRFNDVPVITGGTADEGALFLPAISQAAFDESMASFGKMEPQVRAAYPFTTNKERLQAGRNLLRDSMITWNFWTWARLQSSRPSASPIYSYYFDYSDAKYLFGMRGPHHGAETAYVFDMVKSPSEDDLRVRDLIMSYWVNFARTGNPNGPGLPEWPRFKPDAQKVMYLNPQAHAGPVPNLKQIEAMDAYYEWRRSGK